MSRITDLVAFDRTLAGVALIAAPVLLGGGEMLRLVLEDGAGTEEEVLASITAAPGLWQLMTIVDMVAVALFLPAVLGLIHLLRQRAPVLARLGGGLALVGLLGAAGHNVFAFVQQGAMARMEGEEASMAELAAELERTPAFLVVLLMFLVGFILGMILLAVGLHRSRTAPPWAAAAVGLGMLVFSNAGSSLGLTVVASGLLLFGLAVTGQRVLRMSDDQWRSSRASRQQHRIGVEAPQAPLS